MEVRVLFVVVVFFGVLKSDGNDYCLHSSVYAKKYSEEGLFNIYNRDGLRRIINSVGVYFEEVTCADFAGEKVFVKLIDKLIRNSNLFDVEREVNTLKLLKGQKVSPDFLECIFMLGDVAILHEKVHNLLSSKEMIDKFSSFSLSKKLTKFLQIAITIQTLHKNGITYQSVSPFKIVALDAEMTKLRLYDFRDVLKPGETGKGLPNYYSSPDKLKSYTFVASYNQDAYAFALTMITLLDEDKVLENGIKDFCHLDGNLFSDECKKVFQESLKKLVEKHQPTALYSYIEKHIFSEDQPLNINDLTKELFDTFNKVSPTDSKKEPEVDDEVKALKGEFEANLNTSNNPNKRDII